jgi:long-subunit fatty acid transport protein
MSLIFVLIFLSSNQVFSQQIIHHDSLSVESSQKVNLKPGLRYSVGSSVMFVPHLGTVTAFTLSPSLSVPLSAKLSVNGGIIAGRLYSALWNYNNEGTMYEAFNELSVYGSASYQINPQLTLYGLGIKRLTETSPFYSLPNSSYAIGSTYKFGSFSIGVSLQMSKWNNTFSPLPINFSQGFYSPFEQRHGIFY